MEVGQIRGLINPLDSWTISSKAMTFFKVVTSTELRFTKPDFIKRRWMMDKRVISCDLIIEINIMIRVKEKVANIIKQS